VSRQVVPTRGLLRANLAQPAGALLVVPNQQAQRLARGPALQLDDLARSTLAGAGIQVASKLMVSRLLREAVARVGNTSDVRGFAETASGTISELLRSGAPLDRLARHEQPRIARLGRIAAAYQELLEQEALVDPATLHWAAAGHVRDQEKVMVVGYPRLPAAERHYLNALAAPGSTVYLPAGDEAMFAENREALESFKASGWELAQAIDVPTSGAQIASRWVRGESIDQIEGVQPVVHAYPNEDSQARTVLLETKRLLRQGVSAESIAIVVRDEATYAPQLQRIADEYAVPLRTFHTLPLADTRLGNLLQLLSVVATEEWPFEETARLLAHPLVRVMTGQQWTEIRKHRPSGREGWSEWFAELELELPEQATRASYTVRLLEMLHRLGVRDHALLWSREIAAYNKLNEELPGLPDGQARITVEQFLADIAELLSTLTVPADPRRGGVEVRTPLSLFGAAVEYVFVIGANEGVLPPPVKANPLLDPFEREELRSQGIPVEDVRMAARREEISFWALLQVPDRRLELSFARQVGNDESQPSPYLLRSQLTATERAERPLGNMQELRAYALRRARPLEPLRGDEVLAAARWAAQVESSREDHTMPGPHYGVTGRPWPVKPVGVTSLINMANCPFRFFAEKVLGLEEAQEGAQELDYPTRGHFYHQVLQQLLEDVRSTPDPRRAALAGLGEAFERAEEELGLPALPDWHLQRDTHLAVLKRAIQSPDFLHDNATVRQLEHKFEGEWHGIPVRGRIDRVDELDGRLEFIDYKAGKSISNQAKDSRGKAALDLQLAVYSEAAGAQLGNGGEASVRYFSVTGAATMKSKSPPAAELEAIAARISQAWNEGDFRIDPDVEYKACTYCSFESLCRKGPGISRKRQAQDEPEKAVTGTGATRRSS